MVEVNMRILIRGCGFENKGMQGLLRTTQIEMQKRIPDANFHILTSREESQLAKNYGLFPQMPMVGRLNRLKIAARFARNYPKELTTLKKCFPGALEVFQLGDVDAVLDVSGYIYSDEFPWGLSSSLISQAWLDHCNAAQKPFIFAPQAWGPFTGTQVGEITRKNCGKAQALYARDEQSAQNLRELLNGDSVNIRQAPDLAFRFKGASPERGRYLIERAGLPVDERPIIAITPNMNMYNRTSGSGASNEYVKLLVGLTSFCIDELGANVLLIPHSVLVRISAKRDDRFLCGLVKAAFDSEHRCANLEDFCSAEELKSIYENVNLLVGSRFHSLVFSLSAGTPSIALGWSYKYEELLRPFELNEYTQTHENMTLEGAKQMTRNAWDRQDVMRGLIEKNLPRIHEEIDSVFDEFSRIIKMS
jgi:polysaccharide pyruvyl transferase WcaK-like protein